MTTNLDLLHRNAIRDICRQAEIDLCRPDADPRTLAERIKFQAEQVIAEIDGDAAGEHREPAAC